MENKKHFLEWITVEEFKCFSNFHAEGFKRVNLIGGKNNVGKTALMEAMYVNVHSDDVELMTSAIYRIKTVREALNFAFEGKILSKADAVNLLEQVGIYKSKSNNSFCKAFSIKRRDGIKEYEINLNKESIKKINAKDFNFESKVKESVWYLDAVGFSDIEIVNVFNSVQRWDKEQVLNEEINRFDSNIQSFKVIGGVPQCKIDGIYRRIIEFGDGLRSYISIICSLYACQNGYLFIDEIDNGIYYEHFDRLWEIILTLSKEMSCQVFATTHSKEMLESFARVAKKLEEEDVSYTTLVRNKSNELKAITRDYEMLMDSMEDGREVR